MSKKKQKNIYRTRFDHMVDGKSYFVDSNKANAMKTIKENLARFPYATAQLQVNNKTKRGYHSIGTYAYRKNKKTGRVRLTKI